MKTNNEGILAFSAHLATIRIMIVISSGSAAHLIQRLFESLGFSKIYIAHDANEAVEFLRHVTLHLIVTDSDLKVSRADSKKQLPVASLSKESPKDAIDLSGIQFVHRLRVSPSSPAPYIPILMLMDHAYGNDIMNARNAGLNEILLKPLDARTFCERIIELIDNPRMYITADTYKGPCRRRKTGTSPTGTERRIREIRLVRADEMHKIRK